MIYHLVHQFGFFLGQHETLDIAAAPSDGDVVMIGIGERGGTEHIVGNFLLVQVPFESQFHTFTGDNPAQALEMVASHAVIGEGQRLAGIFDPRQGHVGSIGQDEEIGFRDHFGK